MVHATRIATELLGRDECSLTSYDGDLEVLTKDFAPDEYSAKGKRGAASKSGAAALAGQARSRSDTYAPDRVRAAKLEKAATKLKQEVADATKLYELPAIWANTQGKGIKVAVLDNGVDGTHPALRGAVKHAPPFADDAGLDMASPEVRRYGSHGTHCAGIIAARQIDPKSAPDDAWKKISGIVGYSGLAPEAEILDAKVMRADGSGQLSVVAQGVQWAIDNKADIISMSIQARDSSDVLYRAIQRALENGVLVICGAGNYGRLRRANIGYPGRYGGVVTVASHNRVGFPSDFSATGGEIDVSAPGQGIWSTVPDGFGRKSGTSMAAPFVAGVAALILAKHREVDERARAIAKKLRELDQALKGKLAKAWAKSPENQIEAERIDQELVTRLFDHVVDRHRLVAFRESIVNALAPEEQQGLLKIIAEHDGDVVYNGTPVRNNEDLKDHLVAIAAHPGAHDPHSGYGALRPALYFGVGSEAVTI
jgi:major intracellular serine protease